MSWLLPSIPSLLGGASAAPPTTSDTPTPVTNDLKPSSKGAEPASAEEEEDKDAPPPFPLPDSHQRSSAPSKASSALAPSPPPPPPTFTISAPELRDPLSFTDDDFNYDAPPTRRKAGGGASELKTPTTTTKVVKTREKVGLAPGCSALDWSRAQRAGQLDGVPLRGANLPPHPIRVTPSLLAAHKDPAKGDAWTAINGRVYNISPYARFHPGGVKELMRCAGRDGTKLFMATHAWVNPEFMMEGCWVGMLVPE